MALAPKPYRYRPRSSGMLAEARMVIITRTPSKPRYSIMRLLQGTGRSTASGVSPRQHTDRTVSLLLHSLYLYSSRCRHLERPTAPLCDSQPSTSTNHIFSSNNFLLLLTT